MGLAKGIKYIFAYFLLSSMLPIYDGHNFGTVQSSSHQIRRKQCPFELLASTSSEATLSVSNRNHSVEGKIGPCVRSFADGHHSQKGDPSSEYNCVPTKSSLSCACANDTLQCPDESQDVATSDSEVKEVSEREAD